MVLFAETESDFLWEFGPGLMTHLSHGSDVSCCCFCTEICAAPFLGLDETLREEIGLVLQRALEPLTAVVLALEDVGNGERG